jgi:hypothetical protein
LPEVITQTADGFRLDPGFQVDTIEFSYMLHGEYGAIRGSQVIQRRGDRFWRGSSQVPLADIEAFIGSVDRLRLQPQMLYSRHSDYRDYNDETWRIELCNELGVHVLLTSEGNTSNLAPWNVIYNGRIYSQFDGHITEALPGVVDVAGWSPPASSPRHGDLEEGYLTVDTNGWPEAMRIGFSGLFEIGSRFRYWLDQENGQLRGSVAGPMPGMGPISTGPDEEPSELIDIELDIGGGEQAACSFEVVGTVEYSAPLSDFTCDVPEPAGGIYRYPIQLTFRTERGYTYTLTGQLFGRWEPGTVVAAPALPAEIQTVLEGSPVVRDLMQDHVVVVNRFQASVDPETGSMEHRWNGELTLLGQARTDERTILYTVTVQAGILDSELVQWDLDRADLHALLRDAISHPLSRRLLQGDANLVLNLYYGEDPNSAILGGEYIPTCGDVPVADSLPTVGQPLRAFGFSQSWERESWGFESLQVLLMDGEARLDRFTLLLSGQDAVWASVLPPALQPADAPPLQMIVTSPRPYVQIYWAPSMSDEGISAYASLIETWPGGVNGSLSAVTLHAAILAIEPDGTLSLVSCGAP